MTIYRAATVNIPKPPPEQTAKAIQRRRELRRRREATVSISIFCEIIGNRKKIIITCIKMKQYDFEGSKIKNEHI